MNEFSGVLELLARIRIALGSRGIVGAAWDGDVLRVSHARPNTDCQMFVMSFDSFGDYDIKTESLIKEFADACLIHFGERIAPTESEDAA